MHANFTRSLKRLAFSASVLAVLLHPARAAEKGVSYDTLSARGLQLL